VRLVGGDGAAGLIFEEGLVGAAAGADVVVVEVLVVAGAEQDQVLEFCQAAVLDGYEVVGLEFAWGAAAGVLAVGGAVVECALLGVGGAAPEA
jgi:hypothetical protein